MTIQRVATDTSQLSAWIRKTAQIVNSALNRVDGNIASVSASYTIGNTDHVVLVDTSAPRTITLPGDMPKNFVVTIKDSTGSAGTNTITVSGSIDGGASASITANYGALTVFCDGEGTWWTR